MAYTTIDKPTDYFNTVTYSGNGSSTQAITGVGHQPDWVWIKSRSHTENHMLSDAVRGSTKRLRSDTTNAEDDLGSNGIQSFNTDGFTAGDGDAMNASGQTYVAWNWKAGGSASSNSNGSITSSVSANITAGFSIVSYTGTGSSATVGHGLGEVPAMIFTKNRSSSADWNGLHKSLTGTNGIFLNTTSASTSSSVFWNNTNPTSSVFTVNSNNTTNASGDNYIAYCFAEKKGYSKFGSYTGNGSSDGSYVFLGQKPSWVMIKQSSKAGEGWHIFDNKREGYNVDNDPLVANTTSAEGTSDMIDLLSTGFKLRTDSEAVNESGETYIYMCFAENPFVTSTGIPTTAR